uniref:P12 n=1 Tax=Panagrellus redivivus TaxID=6233 RepID=A0A7E4ZWR3_PANRE
MQIRPLFAVLILGFAVSIAYVQADEIEELEKLSVENLTRLFMNSLRQHVSKLHGKELKKAKFAILDNFPDHPELRSKVNLKVDRFFDLLLKTVLRDLKKMTPRQRAQEKAELISNFKDAQNEDSEEAENDDNEEAKNDEY